MSVLAESKSYYFRFSTLGNWFFLHALLSSEEWQKNLQSFTLVDCYAYHAILDRMTVSISCLWYGLHGKPV